MDTLIYIDTNVSAGTYYLYTVCPYKIANGEVVLGNYNEEGVGATAFSVEMTTQKLTEGMNTISVTEYNIMLASFVPDENTVYGMSVSTDMSFYLFDSDMNQIAYYSGDTYDYIPPVGRLTAGLTYYVGVKSFRNDNASLMIKKLGSSLTEGTNVVEVQSTLESINCFTPETDGFYEIYTKGNYYTKVYLYDSDMKEMAASDDSSENINTFIGAQLAAGQVYYIGVEFCGPSSNEWGTISVVIEKMQELTDGNNMVSVKHGEYKYLPFMPDEEAIYIIAATGNKMSPSLCLYDSGMKQITPIVREQGAYEYYYMLQFLEAKQIYYFCIEVSGVDAGYSGDASLSIQKMPELKEGINTVPVISEQNFFVSFIPTEDGDYWFYAVDRSPVDFYPAEGTLYDSDMKRIATYTNEAAGTFSINYYLKAGQTYYMKVTPWLTGNLSLIVRKGKTQILSVGTNTVNVLPGEMAILPFDSNEDAVYRFYVSGSSDTYIQLYRDPIGHYDNEGSNKDEPNSVSELVTERDTCYIGIGFTSPSDSGNVTVQVVKDTDSMAEWIGTIIKDAKVNSQGYVEVTWQPVDEAIEYVIYRKTADMLNFEEIDRVSNLKATSYVDKTVNYGDLYYYSVGYSYIIEQGSDAGNIAERYYWAGKKVSVLPSAVILSSTSNDSNGNITVNWEKAANIDGYRIYRKTSNSGWQLLGSLSANTTKYTDENITAGITYTYTVRSYKKVNGKTVLGEYSEKGISAQGGLAKVVLKSAADNGKDGVTIKWNSIQNADGYRVYRKVSGGTWQFLKEVTGNTSVSYTDADAGYGTTYIYTVRGYKKVNGATIMGGYDSVGVNAVRYPATVQLVHATTNSNGSITIKWEKVSDMNGYRVFRKISGGNWQGLVNVAADTTTYTDTTGTAGTTYIYTVRAVKQVNGKSVLGGYNRTGVSAMAGLTPVILKGAKDNNNGGVVITWNAIKDADGYRIYNKTSNGGWQFLKEVSGNSTASFTDTVSTFGTTYSYTVRGYKNVNGKRLLGGYDNNGVSAIRYPAKVSLGSAVANSDGSITIDWKKINGMDGYRIFRKKAGGNWEPLVNVNAASSTYTDKDTSGGIIYTYTVRTYKTVNGKNVLGGYNAAGISARASISTVILKSAKDNGNSGITISWNQVEGADGYRIFRKTAGGSWSSLATVVSGGTTSYTDKTGIIGTTYIYTVRAYKDVSGQRILGDYNRNGVSTTKLPATVKLVSATASSGKNILIRWSKVTDCTGYIIYRKTKGTGWTRISKIAGSGNVSYLDTNGAADTTYIYTVRAYKTVNSKEILGGYDANGISAK